MGRNGAGKSTLLGALTGLVVPASGTVRVGATDPRELRGRAADPATSGSSRSNPAICSMPRPSRRSAQPLTPRLVPSAERLRRCCNASPVSSTPELHPRDLSEGQRLALALAVVLTSRPPLLLLDEPTRGLDYPAKARLIATLRELAGQGHGIVLATHDVELAAEVSGRTVVLADGDVVADGPSREVVTASPIFAPQVAKVLAPLPYLTVQDVLSSLATTTR